MKLAKCIALATLLLAGCDKETTLHAGLEERQANLVMAALQQVHGRGAPIRALERCSRRRA